MPPQQPSSGNEILEWYRSIPPVTRTLLTLSVTTSVSAAVGLVPPYQLMFLWPNVSRKLQLWRLVTCFFYSGVDLGYAMNLFFLYRYSAQLETEVFMGRTADYVYFYLITSGLQLAAARLFDLYLLTDGLLMSMAYLWSQHNKETLVTAMFGFRFKGLYLPWVLLAYDFLARGGRGLPYASLAGIAAAHIYYYLTTIHPGRGGRGYLTTPSFLQRLFPARGVNGNASTGGVYMMGRPQQQRQQQAPTNVFGGHSWGRGHRLGS
ncbi:Der1-like family-domain-containing protein [Radiomyces spectabilis]|uniref:Der1-like family-domain-containing protein n=1 Tax=Radiomyces spectabilis TaxID=64574 RepID=UPI00221E9F8C|nr:Der1-like family-domain-containing protein [Radiomyces spectabilis]KAI8369557.1 Der1-like family-domain-containing protein [Radiomyces spectabilis]